jgi:hypothetical protein
MVASCRHPEPAEPAMRDLSEILFFSGSMVAFSLIPLLLLGLAIPYAVLALRDGREVERDPQVGWKSVLYFILSVCILQILTGLTILLIDLMTETVPARRSGLNDAQRAALGTMIAGFLFGAVHLLLILQASNARRFPAARRVFLGARLAVHSLVVLGSLTVLLMQMMAVDVRAETLKTTFSILLVWTPSWIIHLLLMRSAPSAPRPARAAPAASFSVE